MKFSIVLAIFLLSEFALAGGQDQIKKTTDVSYEELALCPGQNAMGVYVYTSAKDKSSLQKIVKIYKKRYAKLNMFNVQFFSDRKKGKTECYDMSDDALSCWVGSYWCNKATGVNELKVVKPGEPHL